MGFAENVKSELEFQDIQVKELAARTGISKNTLDKYLSGQKVQPGVENAVKIAAVLGVTVEYLVDSKVQVNTVTVNLDAKALFAAKQFAKLNAFNQKTVEDLIASLLARQPPADE
ncbi:MAG TPA: helix-turn-helix domain-containing protein [Candidatus Treponema faecavium]|nr:helix-turn-helix domain-containing protein [Candidatus Treponema faecavium]